VTDFEIPATGSAEVHVLHEGYVGLKGDDERVSGTVTLIIDADAVRERLRAIAAVIIPGHGAPFRPGESA
jgi:hypothetical protein